AETRHPDQRTLPRLHRHADRRRRDPRRPAGAAHGAVVRRRRSNGGATERGDRPGMGRPAEPRRAVPVPEPARAALMPRGRTWGSDLPEPHIWLTLGYRGVRQGDGESVIEWDATPEYCFHAPSGPIVHGGMVTTLLDTAMGGACWSTLDEDESFL